MYPFLVTTYYITIKYKRRCDLENEKLENIWLETTGRNKNTHLLIGVVYRPPSCKLNDWCETFYDTIVKVKTVWNGEILITGDMNIDMNQTEKTEVKHYHNIVKQIVEKPTKTTINSATIIDLLIISDDSLVKHTDVLPCELLRDHDGPYAILNIRKPPYEPRFKYICDE